MALKDIAKQSIKQAVKRMTTSEMAQDLARMKAVMPTARIGLPAPGIIIPGKINNVREAVRQSKGDYGARRVERAADEIPNLERMYQEDALKDVFAGDNAKAMMTLDPARFEEFATPIDSIFTQPNSVRHTSSGDQVTFPEYIEYLRGVGGFNDVPFFEINKQRQGTKAIPFISGHEGRHRNRALSESEEKAGLVQLLPRSELREPFPRRTQEDYIDALKQELEMTGNKVKPEKYFDNLRQEYIKRPAIVLPDIYAKGGEVHMAKGGAVHLAGGGLKGLIKEPLKQAVKRVATSVLPAAEREANLAKMLERSNFQGRMYHGTGDDFKEFEPNSFFAFNPKAANSYAESRGEGIHNSGSNVMPVYLNVTNPANEKDIINSVLELGLLKKNELIDPSYQWITPSQNIHADKVIDHLKRKGYDGVEVPDMDMDYNEIYSVQVFDPKNVKSAIGNRGTYDITDPDITKAEGGAVHLAGGGLKGYIKEPLKQAAKRIMPKTSFEMAHDLARMRASLPVEKGGLGLPINNTSEDRARAMGMTQPAFHSTKQDPAVLLPRPPARSRRGTDFGVHVGTIPETANGAIIPPWYEKTMRDQATRPDLPESIRKESMKDLEHYYNESQVMPLLVNPGKSLETPDFGRWDQPYNMLSHIGKETHNYPNYELRSGVKTNDTDALNELIKRSMKAEGSEDAGESHKKAIEDILKERGYGSIAYPNSIEGTGDLSLMFTDPDRVRSRFAAFDPFRRDAATAAAMGVAAPDLLAKEPEKKADGGVLHLAGRGLKQLVTEPLKQTVKRVQELATPTLLPRAKAYSKSELEAMANRMAPQVLNQFPNEAQRSGKYGLDPKVNVNWAGKSKARWERENQVNPKIQELGPTPVVNDVNFRDLQDSFLVGVPGDITRSNSMLHDINGQPLQYPVKLWGGALYGYNNPYFWASGKKVSESLLNRALETSNALGGKHPVGMYMKMPEGNDYALHKLDALLSYQNPQGLNLEQRDALDRYIRSGEGAKGEDFSRFFGFGDQEGALFQAESDPNLRKYLSNRLSSPKVYDAYGLRSGEDLDTAISEPLLRNLETGASGFTMGKLYPRSLLTPSAHPTYEVNIPGSFIGGTRYPVPYELSFPDTTSYVRSTGKPEFGTVKMSTPRQVIDSQFIDQIEQYNSFMKALTGKKKGGQVSDDAIKVEMWDKALHKAKGGPILGEIDDRTPEEIENASHAAFKLPKARPRMMSEPFQKPKEEPIYQTVSPYNPTPRQMIADKVEKGVRALGSPNPSARYVTQGLMGTNEHGFGVADFVPYLGSAMQAQETGRDIRKSISKGDYVGAAIDAIVGGGFALPGAISTAKSLKPTLKSLTKSIEQGAKNLAMPVDPFFAGPRGRTRGVVKRESGNWIGETEKKVLNLKARRNGSDPAELLAQMKERYTPEAMDQVEKTMPGFKARTLSQIQELENQVAINKFVEKNMMNYVKKQMATPSDPVRLGIEARVNKAQDILNQKLQNNLQARQQKILEAKAANADPAEIANLERDAFRYQQQIHQEYQDAVQSAGYVPPQELSRFYQLHNEMSRSEAGYPKEGMATTEPSKQWEGLTDYHVQSVPVREVALKKYEDYPWLNKLNPEDKVHYLQGSGSESLGFSHMLDVLKEKVASGEIKPESLNNMSMDNLVHLTGKYDQELASKINAERASARAGLPVHKEYPEGYKWIELNKPGSFAAESEAMGHSVRGYEPPEGHPDWIEGSGEHGRLDYGHGGWEGIKSGRAKVYSLVDPKGAPHATIEVKTKGVLTDNDFGANDARIAEGRGDFGERGYRTTDNQFFETYADAVSHEKAIQKPTPQELKEPPSITQIKGKLNAAPKEEYQPYVQDFVKSGNWSDVGDFNNTGLYHVDKPEAIQKYGSPYLNQQEFDEFSPSLYKAPEKKEGGEIERPPIYHAESGVAPFGIRHSGEGVKGRGWFGVLPNQEGGISTEISAESNGHEYPLITPSLTKEQLNLLLSGEKPTPEIYKAAEDWANLRRGKGQSPFASPSDLRFALPKKMGGQINHDAMLVELLNKGKRYG